MHCTFDQTCCAFGQLLKPNNNHNLTLTLKLTLAQALTLILTLMLTLTLLQVHCAIDQILRNSSNGAQLIHWSVVQRIWSNVQLTKSRYINTNPNPNPNNPNHNHTSRMENSLEQIQLSVPGDRKPKFLGSGGSMVAVFTAKCQEHHCEEVHVAQVMAAACHES